MPHFQGFLHCKKVLHYRTEWRYICAILIGYARVSTDDQDTAAQVAALKAAGCERIFREKASGGRWDRPELHRLLDHLRKADVNDVALPLLETSRGQISAPVHATTRPGQNVVQV